MIEGEHTNEERVGGETRQEQRARAKAEATQVDSMATGRLKQLYAINKLLARFESVEVTVPEILALMSEVVPLRIAVLILEDRSLDRPRTRAVVWHSAEATASGLRDARARAKAAYLYLARAAPRFEEEVRGTPLPNAMLKSPETRGEEFVLLPLVIGHSRIFGALQLEGATRIDEADLMFVNAIVNQLAIALDRIAVVAAREAATRARQVAAELLADTSAAVFSSLEYDKTLAAVVHAAVPRLADLCFLDEVAEDGRIRRHEVVLADPSKQPLGNRIRQRAPSRDSRTAQAKVLRLGESVLIEGVDVAALDDARADLLEELQSMIVVPLVARERILGALTFARAESGRRYTAIDLALAEEIGRRAAIAIDNARLYADAQRAILARQDLIAVVSHDLRNPLNNILLNTSHLLKSTPPEAPVLTGSLERIKRAAIRMNRMIADLLDLASIEAGHLAVEKTRHPVRLLVEEALETQAVVASQKALRLGGALLVGSLEVDCDRDRMLQVFGNIIGNAIKFTPEGGSITVGAEQRGDSETVFSVTDTGPGIASDELPRVFDRYWQAKKTARLGTGLGLSISKGIVEAHGGRIWAESTPGVGATFFFGLPTSALAVAPPGPLALAPATVSGLRPR